MKYWTSSSDFLDTFVRGGFPEVSLCKPTTWKGTTATLRGKVAGQFS